MQTLLEKGYTEAECNAPVKVKKVPAHLQDRYSTWEEYQDAIADFLNGMWLLLVTSKLS